MNTPVRRPTTALVLETNNLRGTPDADRIVDSLERLLRHLSAQTFPLRDLDELVITHDGLGIDAEDRLTRAAGAPSGDGELAWEGFSPEKLAAYRRSGKAVFLDFTADWCVTCKVNEASSIERDSTRAAFEKAGVVTLVGDWTRRDAAITAFLTDQGAAGVPLYLWYAPGAAAPEQLPQVLTPELLADKAASAGG